MSAQLVDAVQRLKKMRARFDQRQVLIHEFELLVRFEEETYPLWGLYQQATVGNINVPKLDYFDPVEESWMWGWIKGNSKWHAWNKCKEEATESYVSAVKDLESRLEALVKEWKDDMDPMIPDKKKYVDWERQRRGR